MKRFPKLRPNLWDGIMALLVAALAVVCGIMIWGQSAGTGALTVVVSVDGAEVQRCALEEFRPETYTANGYTLQAEPRDGGVCVSVSDCPTQDCVHTGTITRAGQSIVCLPARIIFTLEGSSAESDLPELVVG